MLSPAQFGEEYRPEPRTYRIHEQNPVVFRPLADPGERITVNQPRIEAAMQPEANRPFLASDAMTVNDVAHLGFDDPPGYGYHN